jgi:Co/Zn/Cd efflux system component
MGGKHRSDAPARRIAWALAAGLQLAILAAELAFADRSRALRSEATHAACDFALLLLAAVAGRYSRLDRIGGSVLGAATTATGLEMVRRSFQGAEPRTLSTVALVAYTAAALNVTGARALHTAGGGSVTGRASVILWLADALTSAAIGAGAIAIELGAPPRLDAIVSAGVGMAVAAEGVRLVWRDRPRRVHRRRRPSQSGFVTRRVLDCFLTGQCDLAAVKERTGLAGQLVFSELVRLQRAAVLVRTGEGWTLAEGGRAIRRAWRDVR